MQLIGLISDLTLANLGFMDVKSMIRARTGPAEILQPDASSIATAAVPPTLTPAGESALAVPSSGFHLLCVRNLGQRRPGAGEKGDSTGLARRVRT
jgi:hypothetical protein